MRIERTILSNLIHNEDYLRKVLPFLKSEYFTDRQEQIIIKEISQFFEKYNKPISQEILAIEVSNRKDLTEKDHKDIQQKITDLKSDDTNQEWLVEESESFCKQKAVYNAILDSISIIEGRDKNHNEDAIPHMLQEALGVCFDKHIGHDYLEDGDSRYEFYHRVEEKLGFDLDMFNKITKGGLSKKSLNVALAGTGVGKS